MTKLNKEEGGTPFVSEANKDTKDKELPTHLEDVDRLTFLLNIQKINTVAAHINIIEIQYKEAHTELESLKKKNIELKGDLIEKYSLEDNFKFDDQSGLIIREIKS